MILDQDPLEIFGVYDRGIPNSERIVLRANQPLILTNYILLLGVRAQLGVDMVYPLNDNSLWLGDTRIAVPSWVFVYTGRGTPTISKEQHTGDPIHNLFWNKSQVAFYHDDIVPTLIQMGHVQIGNKPNKTLADLNKTQNPLIGLEKILT